MVYLQLFVLSIAFASEVSDSTEKYKKAMEFYDEGEMLYKEKKYKEVSRLNYS